MTSKTLQLENKLEPKDLLNAMEFLGKSLSSGDDIHSYSKSPIHMLVHNEILKFSKEEIDSCKDELRLGGDLFNYCFRIRNPYIFSAFIKIGAFEDKLSNDSKWLLKQEKNPSLNLYELIYNVEDGYYHKRHSHDDPPEGILFDRLFNSYAFSLDAEKFNLVDKYFKTFGKRKEEHFLQFICDNHGRRSDLCDYLVVKLKNNNVDLSKNSLLNKFLPQEKHWKSNFFISSIEMPKIQKLLECGFRFDEKSYSFYGDNLFVAVVKSNESRLIKPILPYLKDVISQSGNLMEQHQYIESLNKLGDKSNDAETIKFIKSLYEKCLFDIELGSSKKIEKKKIKL